MLSIPTPETAKDGTNPFCTKDKLEIAVVGEEFDYACPKNGGRKICMQRQELRFQSKYRHPHSQPHRYQFKFKLPAIIQNRTHSLRWVIAQWKYEIDEKIYGNNSPSPFLALRFDDGVHHITIQDEDCRCMVASAPHPNIVGNFEWEDGVPKYCQSRKNPECTPKFTVKYGENPILTPPLGEWVSMDIQVQASQKEDAQIIVRENGRTIVTVTGKIGYHPSNRKKKDTKFKIGHYRDYQDSEDTLDIDWIKVSKVK